eukprot:8025825-Alexandrium_andersonii.AAC.1
MCIRDRPIVIPLPGRWAKVPHPLCRRGAFWDAIRQPGDPPTQMRVDLFDQGPAAQGAAPLER